MKKIKQTINTKLIHPVRSSILLANFWLNNYKKVIWMIGAGRSGTTWVSNLINYKKNYREIFEPFHPHRVREMSFLLPHQYIRPGNKNSQFENMASDEFRGTFLNYKANKCNKHLFYDGLLIKDIFANLFASWVSNQFPNVKIILLIRNPFAVALSKFKKRKRYWMKNPLEFLDQSELCEDYLYPFEDLIRKIGRNNDYIQNQLLIWCIINYIQLLQFQQNQIHVVFYEDIYTNPNYELTRIFDYINPGNKECTVDIPEVVRNWPSRVSGKGNNFKTGIPPVSSWKNELTVKQIDAGH
ncbi:MAG: sulfotransferase domain-containing protein [Desulfobacterales bacterium]|nr:sulfotransferase domain-containing protein [Desulfobacterales bacterium]